MKKKSSLSPFEKALELSEKRLADAREALEDVRYLADRNETNAAFEKAFDYAVASEKQALAARVLPSFTGHPTARKKMELHMLDNSPVRVGFTTEGWFCVVIPALLPKRGKGGNQYIHDTVFTGISQFFIKQPPIRFTQCAVAYRNIYCKDRPERFYRDHDNIERKAVTDVLNRFVLTDDGPTLIHDHSYTAAGEDDRTEVFVVPAQDFPQFHQYAILPRTKEIILYEKCP